MFSWLYFLSTTSGVIWVLSWCCKYQWTWLEASYWSGIDYCNHFRILQFHHESGKFLGCCMFRHFPLFFNDSNSIIFLYTRNYSAFTVYKGVSFLFISNNAQGNQPILFVWWTKMPSIMWTLTNMFRKSDVSIGVLNRNEVRNSGWPFTFFVPLFNMFNHQAPK